MLPRLFTTKTLSPLVILVAVALAGGYRAQAHAAQTPTPAPKAPHSVTVKWDPSKSPALGYNVYRATKSGGPYNKLTPTPVSMPQYTDTAVKAGETYFYVVTTVDSRHAESAKSTEIRATVPTP